MRNHNDERICVVWFEDKQGYAIVAPDTSHPTPKGFERRKCTTIKEIDRLTEKLNRQDTRLFERMWHQDRERMIEEHEKHKNSLRRRLLAHDCSPIERVFIQSAFAYYERKEQEYANFKVRGYFAQREFDDPHGDIDHAIKGKQLVAPKMSDRLAHVLSS